ncbi:MAG: VWA domain-containing protein [Acidobacteria bacterium]|nr:VWA domain-containing protein [Acidobacteriota bacterium]
MKLRLAVLVVLLCVAATPARPQGEEPADTTFVADVNLVNLLVNVQDAQGGPIGDLAVEDFTIVDGAGKREITVFERRTNRPLSVALMLDTSLSTAKELQFERDSAKRFFTRLLGPGSHQEDRVAVLQFSDYVEMLTGLTRSERRIEKAMDRISRGGGTSMYDSLYLAASQLKGREGRRVMVVITDGGDTTSYISFQEALKAVHDVDAVIYGIIVIPIRSDAGRNTGGENALKTLAANTGGMTFVQYANENLDESFDQILESLRTQYLIGYYPPKHVSGTERFRKVEVSVSRPGAQVLSRNGYYVSASRRSGAAKARINIPTIQPKPRLEAAPEAAGEEKTPEEPQP